MLLVFSAFFVQINANEQMQAFLNFEFRILSLRFSIYVAQNIKICYRKTLILRIQAMNIYILTYFIPCEEQIINDPEKSKYTSSCVL